MSQCSSNSDPGPNPGNASGGSNGQATCSGGRKSCDSTCVDTSSDNANCGDCGARCGNGQSCTAGKCQCSGGLSACGSSCVNLVSDGANCGKCGTSCSSGQVCSQSKCSAGCASGETACGQSCALTATDSANCGSCGNKCAAGKSCTNGTCDCPGNQTTCRGVCVDTTSDTANCGSCGNVCSNTQSCQGGTCTGAGGPPPLDGGTSPPGDGSTGPNTASRNNCPVKPGLIADFEEGAGAPVLIKSEDRTGAFETFHDMSGGTETSTVESSGGTADCDKWALHIKGSGFSQYAGAGFSLVGAPSAPKVYNATTHQFTGVRFKAKLGATHAAGVPVRFNISTPWTESKENPGGECTITAGNTTKSVVQCYQHIGKFLAPGNGDDDISTSWKTYSYCFDRDLYPLSLPSNLTNEQRNSIGTNILKMQVQFNQGKNYSGGYPATGIYPPFTASQAFDVWLDDVSFFSGDCPTTPSPSNGMPAKAFPQNANVGTCAPATNAPKFSSAIAKAYATWTARFVQTDHVVAPEQNNVISSEAMGYGMLIAASMGDKAAFDKFHGYVKSHGGSAGGLMNWSNSGSGSATDADEDIAYALLMADAQWGGYKSAATDMIGAILSKDIANNVVTGGSDFHSSPFNPSYFAPAAYRKFGSAFAGAITAGYTMVNRNVGANTPGLPTDWGGTDGSPSDHGAAQVVNQLKSQVAFGYDAARVPWRLGLDGCTGGTDKTALNSIINFFSAKYDMGATIDLLKAGWDKASGTVDVNAKDLQGSYIGPMGAGAMAAGNTVMRDRAFRTILDILESGDFNHTYFPSTVGLLTALMMSGNFPVP